MSLKPSFSSHRRKTTQYNHISLKRDKSRNSIQKRMNFLTPNRKQVNRILTERKIDQNFNIEDKLAFYNSRAPLKHQSPKTNISPLRNSRKQHQRVQSSKYFKTPSRSSINSYTKIFYSKKKRKDLAKKRSPDYKKDKLRRSHKINSISRKFVSDDEYGGNNENVVMNSMTENNFRRFRHEPKLEKRRSLKPSASIEKNCVKR